MNVTATRIIGIDTAHRVPGHEGKCKMLHGHRYEIHLTASGAQDQLGRVVDFSVLKELVGGWLDANWDHAVLLVENDPLVDVLKAAGQKVATMDVIPTAENIAAKLLHVICPKALVSTPVRVTSVRVYETPNCYADARV